LERNVGLVAGDGPQRCQEKVSKGCFWLLDQPLALFFGEMKFAVLEVAY
jgi:hypothetical protein